ncbi:MAG: hypothetical protein WDN00_00515 [Limisphaerales bacterium]
MKAASDIRVLVVGNPCNTNSLIAANNAPGVPKERFFAMTALDEKPRQVAARQEGRCGRHRRHDLAIWGNHSATMYPGFRQHQDQRPARAKRHQGRS